MRQDQERSQHSRGHRKILIEDLHRAIVSMAENDEELIAAAMGSPFNQEICEAGYQKGLSSRPSKRMKGSHTLKTI